MTLEYIPIGLALTAVVISSYTDLKDRIIPNKLTYPLIIFGVTFHLLLYIYTGEVIRGLYGLIGASISFGIGYSLWLIGGWAGGDVKLFTALGALLPAYGYLTPPQAPPYAINYPLLPLTILLNSIIASIPILLIYAVIYKRRGRGIFYETIKISKLKEGMIPAELIYVKDGDVNRYDSGRFGLLSRVFKTPEFDEKLTNPDKITGISRENLKILNELVREGELENKVRIKKGMPFAPSLGIGVITCIIYGGLYWSILQVIAGI